jgi:hypothetical protein
MNSKIMWDKKRKPYVFPTHYNRVCFYLDVLDRKWWFVLRHGLTSQHVFENNNAIMPSKEYNSGDGNKR